MKGQYVIPLVVFMARVIFSALAPSYIWLFSPWYLKLDIAAVASWFQSPLQIAILEYCYTWLLVMVGRMIGIVEVSNVSVLNVFPLPIYIKIPVDILMLWGLWWLVLKLINKAPWWVVVLNFYLIGFLSLIFRHVQYIFHPHFNIVDLAHIIYVALFFFILHLQMER